MTLSKVDNIHIRGALLRERVPSVTLSVIPKFLLNVGTFCKSGSTVFLCFFFSFLLYNYFIV